jgi:G3E family GTPase
MAIPLNMITGTLGVGKTTTITSMLRLRPTSEHWAVLVNEYGAVGIDRALIEAGVKEPTAGTC